MKAMELAKGKWPSILSSYGVDESLLDGKHHACPVCQAGTDRFRWISSDNGGRYVCNQCKPDTGDGMELLQLVTGKGFKDLAEEIEGQAGQYVQTKPITRKDPRKVLELIAAGCKLINEDPVSRYLRGRGLGLPLNGVRYHPGWDYYDDKIKKGTHPAMVARILNSEGQRESYHVTYLDDKGNKADVPDSKKILPPVNTIKGCGVYLGPISETMLVGEGIETALAGERIFNYTPIATLTAHGMEEIKLPDKIKRVLILADNDKSFTGQKAAYTLAARLVREGRKVIVKTPSIAGKDFCDVLKWRIENENSTNT